MTDHWQDVVAAFHDADAHHLYLAPDAIEAALEARAKVRLSSIDQDQPAQFRAQAADVAARGVKEAEPELEKLVRSGYRTVVAFGQRGEGERAAYNLGRLKVRWVDGTGTTKSAPTRPDLAFAEARLRDGFIAPGFKLAVIPEHRLFRRRPARTGAGPGGKRRGALRSFTELRTGDIVVHEDHGLARFAGFDTKTVAGVTRDYLELEYAGTDKVFMPVDQLAKISRYVGAGGEHPPLSKLGGTRWDKLKARARRAAQELAGELLNLYAERKRREGHAFAPDSDWLREFEDAFPYRETPDQREAIEQVKLDMEAPRPMDRLVCGDVGYGKTEVALRAAFKAANDGKQVMVLVPTTILAQQHFGTFSERLKDYPFTIEHVSRFRPAADQKAAIASFGDGKVDILIGTHRLLSRDVRAKDLGLLVVDEEQRFGVKQKELLRQIKLRVDVIAMSATPIPRTLQMSIAGIRDISVIETPPEGRRPVKTYIGEYDEQLVKQAIERERARGGQSFFLHNRVETIDETAERLRALCPEARMIVAHGQLDEQQLEERMLSFLRGDADVLVSTSIIESGIDIPQANTLIVERADMFGLAQLYQIRGRVGRSRERAYAYLLYPSAAALTADAATRLSALSDYTELGAGFKVAMRDLEIRGAGNLLGDEQSGHVAALGFELYMQMLDEAVQELGGEEDGVPDDFEPVRLDVNVDAYVPADYVPYEQAKIDVHRRIAGAREVAELRRAARRAGGSLRPAAGAAAQPARAAAGADQARRGRRAVGQHPQRAACRHADRAGLAAREADARGDSGSAVRVRKVSAFAARAGGSGCPLSRDRAGRRRPARGHAGSRMNLPCNDTHLSNRRILYREFCTVPNSMLKTSLRFALALGAFFVAAIALAACGGGSSNDVPSNAVASVNGTPITKADYTRWATITAKGAGANAAVPDPPTYVKCIAGLRKTAKPPKGQPAPATATLLAQCKAQNQQVLQQTMSTLIQGAWVKGEAKDQGIKVTDADVNKQLAVTKKQGFPTAAAYNKFLAQSGMTTADVLERVRVQAARPAHNAEDPEGRRAGHRRAGDCVLQQEPRTVLAARAPRPRNRADEDEGAGRSGEERARRRQELEGGREEVLDRPRLEGDRRRAEGRREGPGGQGARRCCVLGQEGRHRRPGQGSVRLVHRPRHGDNGADADAARAGEGADQAAADAAGRSEADGLVREGLPEEMDRRHELPPPATSSRCARTHRR